MLLGVLTVLFGLIMNGPAIQTGAAVSVEDYWRLVEQSRALVVELADAPPEVASARLLELADRWQGIDQVILADGTQVPLDHSLLAAHLRADPPDLARLRASLDALLAARQTWSSSGPTPADVAALDGVLARSEFQWEPEQRSPLAEWWDRLWERIDRFLSRLIPRGSVGVGGQLLNYVITIVGTLALALVLTYVLRDLLADFVAEAERHPGADAEVEDLTAATALKRAEIVSAEGDYRSAVRYLYLSSLLLLEERGLLRYDRSLTNREYLRNVRHLPRLAATLREVIEVFDRVWYGYRPLDAAEYARYAARVAELRRLQ